MKLARDSILPQRDELLDPRAMAARFALLLGAEGPVTVTGAGVAQDGAGWPIPEIVQAKSTLPVKPLNGMTVIVEVATPALRVAGVRSDRVML